MYEKILIDIFFHNFCEVTYNSSFWSSDRDINGQTGLVCGLVSSKHTNCVLIIRLQLEWRQLTRWWFYPCDTLGTRTQTEQWQSQDKFDKTVFSTFLLIIKLCFYSYKHNLIAVSFAVCNIGDSYKSSIILANEWRFTPNKVNWSSHPSLLPFVHPPSRWVSPLLHTFPHIPVVLLLPASPQVCLIVLSARF